MLAIMNLPQLIICNMVWHLLLLGVTGHIVPIVVTNKCPFTIWPATAPNTGHPVTANGGFTLKPEQSSIIHTPWGWSGRIWARTGCNFKAESTKNTTSPPTLKPACQTGDCDGQLECNGLIGKPPATLVELTLHTDKNQPSFYDVSLVDGYNLPVSVIAGRSPDCAIRGCVRDLKGICPLELQVKDARGNVVACKSACLAFDMDRFCCRNEYGSPEKCKPSLYSSLFKGTCPSYVSYAFDSPSPLVSCLVKELYVTFCPAGWGDRHGSHLEQYASY
ncbi:thaumatin-like protein [Chenopodium quinoa]|uniref:thaumatin-like protein n=1 Tax=Chenopodium quinoa TaxID=63459 RepID=UPI000B782DC1|nr:thaumatin-like protein [Chenopodium quinoa]